MAKLDPLGHDRPNHPLLELSNFGITSNLLDRPVSGGSFVGWNGGTLRELVEKLRATYTRRRWCRIHRHQRQGPAPRWLTQRMEPILNKPEYTVPEVAR